MKFETQEVSEGKDIVRDIFDVLNSVIEDPISTADDVVEALLSAGWRPPMREITKVEEVRNLPNESLVLDSDGDTNVIIQFENCTLCAATVEDAWDAPRIEMFLDKGPLYVIWEPPAK